MRAHSLRLAVAGTMSATGEPALLVACAATPVVTLGESRDASAEVDVEACAARRVPLVSLPGDAPTCAVGEGDLLVSLILPAGRAGELGLPSDAAGRRRWLAAIAAEAAGGGREEVPVGLERSRASLALTLCLGCGLDSRLDGLLRTPPRAAGREAAPKAPPGPAEVAENLLRRLETEADLELVPSMPMPAELDACYDWDRRLVESALGARPSVAGPLA